MSLQASPEHTHAVVVGIEKYETGKDWDLNGPAVDAGRFVIWLRNSGVPAGNIHLFIEPLADNKLEIEQRLAAVGMGQDHIHNAGQAQVIHCLTETLRTLRGDLLYIFWGGHGLITTGEDRRLFFADATKNNKVNLEVDSLLELLQSRSMVHLSKQVAFIDACANYFADTRSTVGLPSGRLGSESPSTGFEQYLLFAAASGQKAENRDVERTGAFSSAVLEALQSSKDTWPPDPRQVITTVQQHFGSLRQGGHTRQAPVYLTTVSPHEGESRLGLPPSTGEESLEAGMNRLRFELAIENQNRRKREGRRIVGQRTLDLGEHFVGREEERLKLKQLLLDNSTRLITLTGRAGIGKTVLTSRVLSELEDAQQPPIDGMVFLDGTSAAGVTLERLFGYCADMMGGEEAVAVEETWKSNHLSVGEKADRLLEILDKGFYVILLDRLEDVLAPGKDELDPDLLVFFERSLVVSHKTRILVTSQNPVEFSADLRRFDRRLPLHAGLSVGEGMRLLRSMDEDDVSDGLSSVPESELAAVVERLHGMPAFLTAFAAVFRQSTDSVHQILERFYGQDNIGSKLIEEAYSRLDQDEQRVIDSVAVFGKTTPIAAVRYMLEPFIAPNQIDTIIRRLISIRMLEGSRETQVVDLSPIDREFVNREIRPTGQYSRQSLHRRAAQFFGDLAPAVLVPGTLDDIEPRIEQFNHLVRAEDYDSAAKVLTAIDERLIYNGRTRVARAMHSALEGKLSDERLQVLNLFWLGEIFRHEGLLEASLKPLQEARDLAIEIEDTETARRALGTIGDSLRQLGRWQEAIEVLAAASAAYTNDMPPRYSYLEELSLALSYARRYREAIAAGTSMLETAMGLSDEESMARAHDALSLAYVCLPDPITSLSHCSVALELYEKIGHRGSASYVANVEGMAYLHLDNLDAAVASFEKGIRYGNALGISESAPRPTGLCLFNLARAHQRRASTDEAIQVLRQAKDILTSIKAAEAKAAVGLLGALLPDKLPDNEAKVRNLLECARACNSSPDLYPPSDLLEEAAELASKAGLSDLAKEISLEVSLK